MRTLKYKNTHRCWLGLMLIKRVRWMSNVLYPQQSLSHYVCQKTSSSNMYSFQIKQTKFINLRDAKSSLTQPICSSCEQHHRGWISPSLTSLIEQITHIDGAEQHKKFYNFAIFTLSRLTIVEETLLFTVVYACTVELSFAYLLLHTARRTAMGSRWRFMSIKSSSRTKTSAQMGFFGVYE